MEGKPSNCWAMGSITYVKEAIRVSKSLMKTHNLNFTSTRRKGANTPFSNQEYRPELDTTPFCDDKMSSIYHNLIGILRWTCELGRIDILHETAILSQYVAQQRKGHLQQFYIFYYLEHHDRSWMLMDHTSYDIEWNQRKNESSPQERATEMRKYIQTQ